MTCLVGYLKTCRRLEGRCDVMVTWVVQLAWLSLGGEKAECPAIETYMPKVYLCFFFFRGGI